MPTTPGAQKSLRNQKKKATRNLRRKRDMKDAFKQLEKHVDEKEYAEANELLPNVYKAVDKAKKVGVIKENKAARLKARASKIAKKPE